MASPFNILIAKLEIFIVFLCAITCICGRRFAESGYYSHGYYNGQPYDKIETALSKLDHAPQWVSNWPDASVKLGQVSGVALDNDGRLLVFHRASNVWDANTFTNRDVYQGIGEPPIPHATVLVFNDTGELVDMWGQNLFYMPHGITVDKDGNVFTTDVALHQVFKFVPGDDDQHFCKPSAVAVLPTGDFFVADGYCNHRILKIAPDGTIILQWGRLHFCKPSAVAVLPTGDFFVADGYCNHRILKIAPDGTIILQWGRLHFCKPSAVAVLPTGDFFVADGYCNHRILKIAPDGTIILQWGRLHFCKPSAVAVLPTGDFFVADGYCNHRILKIAPDGSIILQWGRSHGDSPFVLNVPHALTLAADRALVCVADRERGRVACFRADNGTFAGSFSSWLIGSRLFSMAYAPVHETFAPAAGFSNPHDVVTSPDGSKVCPSDTGSVHRDGPGGMVPVRGYAVDFTTGRLIETFAPAAGFSNPHDVVTSPDGSKVCPSDTGSVHRDGPGGMVPVRGYAVDFTTGRLIETFAPAAGFSNPHDVVTSPDGSKVCPSDTGSVHRDGPGGMVPVRGYAVDFTTGRLIETFAPAAGFSNPHDVVTSPDGSKVCPSDTGSVHRDGPGGMVPVRGYAVDFTTGRLIETFAPAAGFSNPHDVVTSPDGSKKIIALKGRGASLLLSDISQKYNSFTSIFIELESISLTNLFQA
ncbi:Peptidyl-alpha-hydroxyglycine alpha-amidating lyase 1 [Operophtera brumata]|uniref:peptidylamidoglycolate lyase n=1 Tax=Operophtera brumata TaxID=104452 RepID=A0A0L7LA08_OPEBR|nr:Peptidyl-alpha-hydroxyglycine alpha-amidating lyase 1 [Operophtera brumata]